MRSPFWVTMWIEQAQGHFRRRGIMHKFRTIDKARNTVVYGEMGYYLQPDHLDESVSETAIEFANFRQCSR